MRHLGDQVSVFCTQFLAFYLCNFSFRGVFDSGTWNLLNVEVLLWSSDVNAFAFVKVDVILYFQFDQVCEYSVYIFQPIEVYAFASVTVDVIFYQLDQVCESSVYTFQPI